MDLSSFQKELTSLVSFPQAILTYATQVSETLTDEGRDALLAKLRELHGQLKPLEEEGAEMLNQAVRDLKDIEKDLHKEQSAAEEQARGEDVAQIEAAMNA
ncbi:MAG: hypothetical protein WCX61_03455 [Candidatus Peribacteraceae bacterium]|jgi:hypothetical protein